MSSYRVRIESDYGTFRMHRTLELTAPDLAAAHAEAYTRTGVMLDLQGLGWVFERSPDGEVHTVTITHVDGVRYRGRSAVQEYGT